jgi:GAF domain-containing protein
MTAHIESGYDPDALADAGTRQLLQSVVDVARAFFGAAGSSVFLFDEVAGDLVFQAVSGAGEDDLVGTRMPSNKGIAGWVLGSGQAVIVDDLATSQTFAKDFAESTHYVPKSLMAAPLLSDLRALGVLEVIDPQPQQRSGLSELDLLSLFSHQAATALQVSRTCTQCRAPRVADPEEQMVAAFRDFLRDRT